MTDSTFAPALQTLLDSVPPDPGARIATASVDYDHDGTPLEGYIAADDAQEGPRPGILVIHDWTGVGDYVRVRAQMLARLGYVAFAADIYGKGVRPTGDDASAEARKYYADLALMRGRVEAGYRQLCADPRVDSSRTAVIGYCFGGSAALQFARTGADIRGVVSFHGGLQVSEPSDADAIRAKLLVLTGGSDPAVPDEAVTAFKEELRGAEHVDWQVTTYSGAPHAFTIAGSDRYRPLADARSWQAMRAFFDEIFA